MSEDAPLCGPRLLGPEELHECLTAIPLEDVRQRVRDHIEALRSLCELMRGRHARPDAFREPPPAAAVPEDVWNRDDSKTTFPTAPTDGFPTRILNSDCRCECRTCAAARAQARSDRQAP